MALLLIRWLGPRMPIEFGDERFERLEFGGVQFAQANQRGEHGHQRSLADRIGELFQAFADQRFTIDTRGEEVGATGSIAGHALFLFEPLEQFLDGVVLGDGPLGVETGRQLPGGRRAMFPKRLKDGQFCVGDAQGIGAHERLLTKT